MAIDWGKIGTSIADFAKSDAGRATAGGIGGLLALTSLGESKSQPVGYQGGIPQYTATRTAVAGTNPPGRRPGSGGQRYFTDTQFTKNGLMPGYPSAEELAAKNAANDKARTEGIAALIAAMKGGKTTTPATTTSATPAPTTQGKPLVPAKTMSDEEKTWSKDNPLGGSLASDLDSLEELQAYATNAMKSSGGDGSDRAVNSGEASQILKAATGLGVSPKQIADMLGVSENEVVNRIRIDYPHLGMNYAEKYGYAKGGIAGVPAGRYLGGQTDGMADEISTSIDGKDPAALSHGEFIVPADVVSHLGNGNSDAGAKMLYSMMERIRQARTGTKQQGRRIDPNKFVPA